MINGTDQQAAADVTNCEREPIQTPGTIQPHGFLVAADPQTWLISHASENAGYYLGHETSRLLGATLVEVLGADLVTRIERALADPHVRRRALPVRQITAAVGEPPILLEIVAHLRDDRVIVEGEAMSMSTDSLSGMHHQMESFLSQMERTSSIDELHDLVAKEVRRLTGFDRVLIYQFDRDWNGTVIGESRNERLPSYLDLRFPASDIPAQARELYRLNRIRLIADVDYTPIPIVAMPGERDVNSLDLSLSVLRSVSPVHLEYMRNMGTRSSMSVSIMRGGELWGLISCHGQEPLVVPFQVRTVCDLLGQVFSLQLSAREQAGTLAYRMKLTSRFPDLLAAMAQEDDLATGLTRFPELFLHVTAAAGAAVVSQGQAVTIGDAPPRERVLEIVQWLGSRAERDVFHTDSLASIFPEAAAFADCASGLLAISISQLQNSYLLWFRPEVVRTVKWGGDPRKLPGDSPTRLHPRRSFEAWKEVVRGKAQPWTTPELETAAELRNAIIGIVLLRAERLAALSRELQQTNKELEAFSYTVSHDLRAPFRHIRGYAELLSYDKAQMLDDEGREFLAKILDASNYAGTLVDNMLTFSQMGRSSLRWENVPLSDVVAGVRGTLKDLVANRDIEWRIGRLPHVWADPVLLRVAVQNLIENAVKYSRERPLAIIEISAKETGAEHIIYVKDNGVGFDMKYADKLFGVFQRLHAVERFEGTGIGLASVRRIIGRHGGRTWAESVLGEGATFFFSLPKEPRQASPSSTHAKAHSSG